MDSGTNTTVMVKVLLPDVAADPDATLQFAREAEAARLISHPNVARTPAYVGANLSGIGAPYLVMEYVGGGDLAALITTQNGAPLDRAVLLDWMTQLAKGLQAIHEHVLHRDIKPQNVLVDSTTLKISDFGMSKYIEAATRTVTFKGAGTPLYMAPETWRRGTLTRATDIYSLGVLFYHLATYHFPFMGADEIELRRAHLFTAVPRPSVPRADLDDRLDGMIVRMLEKRPADRYQSVEEIIRLLAQISSNQPAGTRNARMDDVVRAARQTYDHHKAAQNQKSAQEEARRDSAAAINYQLLQLAHRLDGLVEQANGRLPETPITIQKLTDGAFVDAMTGTLRSYGYFDTSLDLGFLSVSPSDVLIEHDPMPGVTLPYQTKKMTTREVTVDGTSIVAVGFLKLTAFQREHVGNVGFTRPVAGSYDRGLHLLLLRTPDELYGIWKTCELQDHPLLTQGPVRQRMVLPRAKDVVEAVASRNSVAAYTVNLRDFTDADFIAMVNELVSS